MQPHQPKSRPRHNKGRTGTASYHLLTFDQVSRRIAYDPIAGTFTWRIVAAQVKPGSPAGSVRRRGYHDISLLGQDVPAHRVAWMLMTGAWPDGIIDHKNCDRADNRWENLRLATKSGNRTNSKKQSGTTSRFKGVYHRKNGKWAAYIKSNAVHYNLGTFSTEEQAADAYSVASARLHGEFARAA